MADLKDTPALAKARAAILRAAHRVRDWPLIEKLIAESPPADPVVFAFHVLLKLQQHDHVGAHAMLRAGRKNPRHHVLITGTGRSGTTAIIELLTVLGLDTGFDPDHYRGLIYPTCNAGLERDIFSPNAPRIVKSPETADRIDELLARPDIVVDALIVPVRDLNEATDSRLGAQQRSGSALKHGLPGGLIDLQTPENLQQHLATRVAHLLHMAAEFDVPLALPAYPRFVHDHGHLHSVLAVPFGAELGERDEFLRVAQQVLRR
jgi:hypothetical protein